MAIPFLSLTIFFVMGFLISFLLMVAIFFKYFLVQVEEKEETKTTKIIDKEELRKMAIEKQLEDQESMHLYSENNKRSLAFANKKEWQYFLDETMKTKRGYLEMMIPKKSELFQIEYDSSTSIPGLKFGVFTKLYFYFVIYQKSPNQKYLSLVVMDEVKKIISFFSFFFFFFFNFFFFFKKQKNLIGRIHLSRCEIIESNYPRGMKDLEGTAFFLKILTMESNFFNNFYFILFYFLFVFFFAFLFFIILFF